MSQSVVAPPVIVIFGITGDLSKRKLLPALYHLLRQDVLPANTKIVGVSRHAMTPDELLATVELCVLEKDQVCDPVGLRKVRDALHTVQLQPDNPADYGKLKQALDSFDQSGPLDRLLYMALPATAYASMVPHLAAVGLNQGRNRILFEKPFGYDVSSAQAMLELVSEHFTEQQVYRIDHYLAKETAQNLLTFRMHNPIFMPLWNGEHIHRVHIRATETIGIEGRVNFYEQTGALRDFMQSHLMQLLALTLMDLPAHNDMSSQAIHAAKQAFFADLQPADPTKAVRAQYHGYRDEVGNPDSQVETYAQIELSHQSARWQGTELVLETGKGMDRKSTEITVEFKTPGERRHNQLVFRLQPDEGIGLDLVVKQPGFDSKMHHTSLDFSYQETFGDQHIDAYERVVMDAIRGDQSLFASDADVQATWRVLQPILDAWARPGSDLLTYPMGSDRPQPA